MSIKLICTDHPKYQAVYPPKIDCLLCWKIYATKLKLKIKEMKVKK